MIKNECRHAYLMLDKAECLWCEECVEKLANRLSKKSQVTDEWIEEKATWFVLQCPGIMAWYSEGVKKFVKGFIRSLVEEITK